MRLYVLNKSDGNKIHLKQSANTRNELEQLFGSRRIEIDNHEYNIADVTAEPSQNTAPAMALGGGVGVLGGVPGVIIGSASGALLGNSSDEEDKIKVEQFNRSSTDAY